MIKGTHAYGEDDRNRYIKIYINGELLPREEARISVFDSGFLLGDGVWEGIRLQGGHLLFLEDHLDRLFASARAIALNIDKTSDEIKGILLETLRANGMVTDVHIRLIISRGLKRTPYQHPQANIGGPTIVVIPEYKVPSPDVQKKGLKLHTVAIRRGTPDTVDPKLNTLSKMNCILACIQAEQAEADEALMLDMNGFVATCNSTNFFMVTKGGEVWTSTGDYCLNGVTRKQVIAICEANRIPVFQRNFSLVNVYHAQEAFVTGTFGGLLPVTEIDGHQLSGGRRGAVTARLQKLYLERIIQLYPPQDTLDG
jgi:branched-chain amino acid aminotransferase